MLVWGDTGFDGPRTAVVVEIGPADVVALAVKVRRNLYRLLPVRLDRGPVWAEGGTAEERATLAVAGHKVEWREKPE